MARVETLDFSHLAPGTAVHVAIFNDLQNASFLRQQLLEGNAEFEYAFVDAKAIIGPTQVMAAIFRAVNDLHLDRLKTRNVHSEIVFSLSPNNNIAESFRKFGVTDGTKSLLAIKVSTIACPVTIESVTQHLTNHVQGEILPFSDETLSLFTDWALVKKMYKLSPPSTSKKAKPLVNGSVDPGCSSRERRDAELAAVASMALKGS